MSGLKKPLLPKESRWLRATLPRASPTGVARDKKAVLGYTVAQEGPFKDGRGEFDAAALKEIVRLGNAAPKGLKSNFSHSTLSADGLGKFLGRARDFRMSTATDATGKTVQAVRGDLYFDESAFKTPSGDLATYVMDLAESDPAAISSSLVIQPEEKYRRDEKGVLLEDKEGNPLPPLWWPVKLHGSDIVDTGAAVDGLLSVEGLAQLPDGIVREATRLLNKQFPDADRETLRARCLAWLERYLDLRFGAKGSIIVANNFSLPVDEAPKPEPNYQEFLDRLEQNKLAVKKYRKEKR